MFDRSKLFTCCYLRNATAKRRSLIAVYNAGVHCQPGATRTKHINIIKLLWYGFCSGRSQPGTHVGDRRPSVQRSSLRMRMCDMAALTDRVSCCAPSALFRDEGKGRAEMRAKYFWPIVTYARRTEASCLASGRHRRWLSLMYGRGLNLKTRV